jgi:DNA invertase Pin-like site-specific DNA recombinase
MGRLYGYVRVSTGDQENSVLNQSERIQELAAKEGLPLEHVYVDEDVTARIPLKDRPQGRLLWDVLDPGDTVAFNRVDRVFRSVSDASQTVQIWQQRGIRAIIMDLGIDLATPAGRMFFHQLASFAEFERECS